MLASAGLQMSQPRPVPKRWTIEVKVVSPDTRTASNSCARVNEKCSHNPFETSFPDAASSVATSFFTSVKHEPHAAPAFVHALTSAASAQLCSVTASRTVPAVTPLHEQTIASAGRSPCGAGARSEGMRYAAGSPPRARPTRGRSEVYADASPTRMPPSSVCASSLRTSFL